MIKSACDLMKRAVVLSVMFIAGGSLFVLMAQLLPLETMVPVIFTYLGLFSMFAGVLVIFVTIMAIMMPKVSRQLDLCQH